jgi:Fe2+ transport system protein FeoA
MCGYEFDAQQLACHSNCPLGDGCLVICCPRCGYGMVNPARSTLSQWARRLLARRARPAPPSDAPGVPLLSLEPGQGGQVVAMDGDSPERLHHLSQYGLTPGTPIRLRQKRPVPIVQVGETDLALDAPIAATIYVERVPAT